MLSRVFRQPPIAVALIVAVGTAASCDKVALVAPTDAVISISTNRTVLPLNGTAEIRASIVELSGTSVHNGTLVTFTTNLGRLEPEQARTTNGQAVATLHAGTESGTATVRAFSGGAQSVGDTGLSVTIGAAAADAMTVTATPAELPSTGGSSTISAAVIDSSGNRLVGVRVAFTTTGGSLSPFESVTDAAGVATTTLTTTVAATVTATLRGGATPIAGMVNVAIRTAPTITIVAPVGATAGSAATFTVSTTVAPGSAPITAVDIVFGDGSGAVSLGNLTGTTSVTHVYLSAGTYTAVVTLTDSGGERVTTSAVVRVVPAVPLNVNISASPTTGTVDEVVTFNATVTGSSVPIEGFDWTFGDGIEATTSGTSVNHVYTTAGTRTVTVTATTVEGVSGSTQLTLIVVPLQIEITLNISPLNPSSGATVLFTATVTPATVVITRYDWDFGDTTTLSTSGRSTSHAYVAPTGTSFTATVTAVAFDGTTTQTQGVVTIR